MMIFKNFFTSKCNGLVLTAVILVVFGQVSFLYGAGRLLVWPLKNGAATLAEADASLKAYEIRKGPIALAPEILQQTPEAMHQTSGAVSEGDIVTITFFDNVTYHVTVDSVTNHPKDTMTISGRLHDHMIGTVVLTIDLDGFLITLQDLNRTLLYRAVGSFTIRPPKYG
jgi:hypothetical protein